MVTAVDKSKSHFNLRYVYDGPGTYVGVGSVLPAIATKVATLPDGITIAHGKSILALWHAAIAKLEGAVDEEARVRWLRCPPVGFKARANGFAPQSCRAFQWCPFCWGRRAAGTYQIMADAMFPEDQAAKWYGLIKRNNTIRLSRDYADPAAGISTGAAYEVAYDVRAGKVKTAKIPMHTRAEDMQRAKCLGAVEVMSCDFKRDAEGVTRGYFVRINQLFVVPYGDGFRTPETWHDLEESRYPINTREALADALVDVYRYPTQLLHVAPVEQTNYLKVHKKRRMVEHYGFARQSKVADAVFESE